MPDVDTILILRPGDQAIALKRLVKITGRYYGWDCVAVLPEDPLASLEYLTEQARNETTDAEVKVLLSAALGAIHAARRKAKEEGSCGGK